MARRKAAEAPSGPEKPVQTPLGPATLLSTSRLGEGYVRLEDGTERWVPKEWLGRTA